MNIQRIAKAGTVESNDIFITVIPNPHQGTVIELESIVLKQFGQQIKQVILKKVSELGIEHVRIIAEDYGALDFTIRARLQTAIERAM